MIGVTDPTMFAGMLALAIGLAKTIDVLIGKLGGKKSKLTQEEHDMLKELHNLHDRRDEDGIPIWYVPRSWSESQKEIVAICREISETQRAIAGTLERLEARMDK